MLYDEDIAELRKRNLADNQQILQKIKADMQQWLPKVADKQAIKPKQRRPTILEKVRKNPSRAARYSPPCTRSRRGSMSSEASSSSSLVSSPDRMVVKFGFFGCQSNSLDTVSIDDLKHKTLVKSPTSQDDFLLFQNNIGHDRRVNTRFRVLTKAYMYKHLDEEEMPPAKKRRITLRDIRSADEITEEDLEMVAVNVRDKNYDKEYGTTCHQCRQKTDDLKTICRSEECFGVKGQFCGPCLRNRYGEDAKEALKNPNWNCPPCRGICNCSFCRRNQGKTCTGILVHLAKQNGFTNVNDYLQSLREKVAC